MKQKILMFNIRFIIIAFLLISPVRIIYAAPVYETKSQGIVSSIPANDISARARRIINSIVEVVGLKANFEIQPAKIPNAAAVIYAGKRYILYNPDFIAAMDQAAGKSWASIAILAHETGHHLNGHTLGQSGSLPHLELEADEFSGFALRKMGATLSDAQLAIRIAGSLRASHTHPAKSERLIAIGKGWEKAHNQINVKEEIAISDDTPPSRTQPEAIALPDKYIAYEVHFVTEPSSKYFVTVRNNFVKLNGNELMVLGKLSKTDKSSYPLMLFNGNHQVFFINDKGVIYTDNGRKIGWINQH